MSTSAWCRKAGAWANRRRSRGSTSGPRQSGGFVCGFSLIEVIGVLAILAVLAAVVGISVFKRINQARITQEAANLPTLGDALRRQILRQRTIPYPNWAQTIADEMGLPLSKVTLSPSGVPRVFLIDPALQIGTNAAGTLPYLQTTNGAANPPANARLLLVSSLSQDLTTFLSSGTPSATVFSNIWNAPPNAVPAGWPASWSGKADDVQIHRLNLVPSFRRLIINNLDPVNIPWISIDTNPPMSITTNGFSGYFLEGTVIGFYNNNQLESRDLCMIDSSYVYERGIWRGQLWEGKLRAATDLIKAVNEFFQTPAYPGAKNGVTNQTVINDFYTYALTYVTWARVGFPAYQTKTQLTPQYQSLKNAQNDLDSHSGNLYGRN